MDNMVRLASFAHANLFHSINQWIRVRLHEPMSKEMYQKSIHATFLPWRGTHTQKWGPIRSIWRCKISPAQVFTSSTRRKWFWLKSSRSSSLIADFRAFLALHPCTTTHNIIGNIAKIVVVVGFFFVFFGVLFRTRNINSISLWWCASALLYSVLRRTVDERASEHSCFKFIVVSNHSLVFINTLNSIVRGRFNASKTTINSLNADAPFAEHRESGRQQQPNGCRRLRKV